MLDSVQWLRIYSLPFGKRYSDSQEESRTVLHKYNEVISAIFAGNTLHCCISSWSDNPDANDLPKQDSSFQFWRTMDEDPNEESKAILHPYDGKIDVITQLPRELILSKLPAALLKQLANEY